eukprot:g7491.t1
MQLLLPVRPYVYAYAHAPAPSLPLAPDTARTTGHTPAPSIGAQAAWTQAGTLWAWHMMLCSKRGWVSVRVEPALAACHAHGSGRNVGSSELLLPGQDLTLTPRQRELVDRTPALLLEYVRRLDRLCARAAARAHQRAHGQKHGHEPKNEHSSPLHAVRVVASCASLNRRPPQPSLRAGTDLLAVARGSDPTFASVHGWVEELRPLHAGHRRDGGDECPLLPGASGVGPGVGGAGGVDTTSAAVAALLRAAGLQPRPVAAAKRGLAYGGAVDVLREAEAEAVMRARASDAAQ